MSAAAATAAASAARAAAERKEEELIDSLHAGRSRRGLGVQDPSQRHRRISQSGQAARGARAGRARRLDLGRKVRQRARAPEAARERARRRRRIGLRRPPHLHRPRTWPARVSDRALHGLRCRGGHRRCRHVANEMVKPACVVSARREGCPIPWIGTTRTVPAATAPASAGREEERLLPPLQAS